MNERTRVSLTVAAPRVARTKDSALGLASHLERSDHPERILVVAQASDLATQNTAQEFGVNVALVPELGPAREVETAIQAATTEVIAFVDDDHRALPDWAGRILKSFGDDPLVGLLDGRDNVDEERSASTALPSVGVIRRGRPIGKHHLGHGPACPLVHVKGANMSVRVAPDRPALGRPAGSLVGLGAGLGVAERLAYITELSPHPGPLRRIRLAPGHSSSVVDG